MTSLVENLLSLARADGGAEAVTLTPIEVRNLFQRVEKTWRATVEFALIDFRVDVPGSDPVLLGDAAGVSRLLSILLENASKYTPPGGSVVLSAKCSDTQILISVRDTGLGILEEDLPRIFDRFYRGGQACGQVSRGSGLGLALAKWIAERHGTQLKVESRLGHGSCFSFSLQRVVRGPNLQADPQVAFEAASKSPSPGPF